MNPIAPMFPDRRQFLRRALALAAGSTASLTALAQQQEASTPFFYPLHAIHAGLEGLAKVYAELSTQGYATVVRIEQSSGHTILDQAAEGTIALWVFRRNLAAAKRKLIIPLEFKLVEATRKDLPRQDDEGHFKARKPKAFYPYRALERRLTGGVKTIADVTSAGLAEKALIEKANPAPILNQCALLFTLLTAFGSATLPGPRRVVIPWEFRVD